MIFGDPYKFAIQFDFVEDWFLEWGEDLKNDGVFHYIIQGYILPVETYYLLSLYIKKCIKNLI